MYVYQNAGIYKPNGVPMTHWANLPNYQSTIDFWHQNLGMNTFIVEPELDTAAIFYRDSLFMEYLYGNDYGLKDSIAHGKINLYLQPSDFEFYGAANYLSISPSSSADSIAFSWTGSFNITKQSDKYSITRKSSGGEAELISGSYLAGASHSNESIITATSSNKSFDDNDALHKESGHFYLKMRFSHLPQGAVSFSAIFNDTNAVQDTGLTGKCDPYKLQILIVFFTQLI